MIAKAVNAFKTAMTGATADTDFTTTPLTATQIDSPIHNLQFLAAVVANVHSDLAYAIAAVTDENGIGNHPWRVHFADTTANVANAAALPTVGASGKTIIGALGQPWDAANVDQLMIRASIERVSSFNNDGIYSVTPNIYAINSSKVFHSTANIIFDCCAYDRADVAALIAANGSFGTGAASRTVPDTLTMALIAGGIAMSIVEDEMLAQVAPFAAYYAAVLERIANGNTVMPSLPVEMRRAA